MFTLRRLIFILAAGSCFVSQLCAEPDASRARIALFQPAAQKEDTTLTALLCTVADSVELSLDLLQRYEVRRLPPADLAKDLSRVRTYCQENRIDQAVLGSGSAQKAEATPFGWLSMTARQIESARIGKVLPAAHWTPSM